MYKYRYRISTFAMPRAISDGCLAVFHLAHLACLHHVHDGIVLYCKIAGKRKRSRKSQSRSVEI